MQTSWGTEKVRDKLKFGLTNQFPHTCRIFQKVQVIHVRAKQDALQMPLDMYVHLNHSKYSRFAKI